MIFPVLVDVTDSEARVKRSVEMGVAEATGQDASERE